MTTTYSLLRPEDHTGREKTEPVSITITVCHNGARSRKSTKERIQPKYWNGSRVKTQSAGFAAINAELDRIEKELDCVLSKIKHRLTNSDLDELVGNVIVNREARQEKKTIETWVEQYIKEAPLKPSSKQVHNSSLDHLKAYAEKYNIVLTWDVFTLDFHNDFQKYLWSTGKSDNTVGKVIKCLKRWIREAFDRDLHQNLNFQKKGFKVISSEVDEIYLTEAEITAFYNVKDLPHHLELSKQRFVFGCWVGLRYGDLISINPNNILQGLRSKLIRITTTKTGEDVIIPLNEVAEEIWKTWNGIPPKAIHNAKFNKHVKEIAKRVDLKSFKSPVQKRKTVRGRVTIEWVPKHEMVKAHTMRRSFATNCYLLGVPKASIMAVTGHRTEKSFNKYLRITKEQHANIMAEYFHVKPEEKANMKVG
jgi:site-specific recombinase XerD